MFSPLVEKQPCASLGSGVDTRGERLRDIKASVVRKTGGGKNRADREAGLAGVQGEKGQGRESVVGSCRLLGCRGVGSRGTVLSGGVAGSAGPCGLRKARRMVGLHAETQRDPWKLGAGGSMRVS